MQIIEKISAMRRSRDTLSGIIGLVPTMGYLHAGHLSLIKAAHDYCDHVAVTIFVNPTQFSAAEDLSTYPRDLPRDIEMLENAGVDVVFAPRPDKMYPDRYQTYVTVEEVTKGKEGGLRPHHFRGVTTVVAKLLNIVRPHYAYFGQKDAQQVVVLRQMVRDLNVPVQVIVCPIIRESDGLALSSRNVYLSVDERKSATGLYHALNAARDAYALGERDPNTLRRLAGDVLRADQNVRVDYVSLADARTLEECVNPCEQTVLLSIAAQVGKPRLLDNCLLPFELNTIDGLTANLGYLE